LFQLPLTMRFHLLPAIICERRWFERFFFLINALHTVPPVALFWSIEKTVNGLSINNNDCMKALTCMILLLRRYWRNSERNSVIYTPLILLFDKRMIKTNIVISPAPGISHDTSSAQHMIKMNPIIHFIFILFILIHRVSKYGSIFYHFLNGERSHFFEKIDTSYILFMKKTNIIVYFDICTYVTCYIRC
jgi:hypothetical protein